MGDDDSLLRELFVALETLGHIAMVARHHPECGPNRCHRACAHRIASGPLGSPPFSIAEIAGEDEIAPAFEEWKQARRSPKGRKP